MSFFDELTQKAKVVAATASEKAREAADSAKISAAILTEKRELDRNYRAIGQWYVSEYQEVPEAIADVIAAVRASQEKIAELQARREEGWARLPLFTPRAARRKKRRNNPQAAAVETARAE